MNTSEKNTLALLIQLYEYDVAYQFASKVAQTPKELLDELYVLKERLELNIEPALKSGQVMNQGAAEEQIANYLLDLEAKLKKGQIIDFVRAVSPIIYRLFMRLLSSKVPDIKTYILDNKDDRYDVWKREVLAQSSHPVLRDFKTGPGVTSSSLARLILLLDFSEPIKDAVANLRELERSVRNPLAHLIRPFDEEELRRTTNFSSQTFLKKLVELARLTGIEYSRPFYFDQLNQQLLSSYQLSESTLPILNKPPRSE
ncbi:hypothetical protein ABID29_000334 [Streptococcus rupicaprae]|uniref:Csm6 HEPN domain-containing protein n=1 Tax=Streptococcus rupicaprae TaxID=759619 RepID=A0ABV2FFM0_9STRE